MPCWRSRLETSLPATGLFDVLPAGRDYHVLRGGLANALLRFERERKGRVAFMGGSITEAQGWRDLVCKALEVRFPETKFDFINAGISSTGSVPGAFRLVTDVFGRGRVDLLFEEAAVNDHVNMPGRPLLWRRGMEGIVRHARALNPELDVVMLHLADPEKVAEYNAGKRPAVISVHDAVAEHYDVPSIDLAREVTERIAAGQFTWEKDFKSLHPSPFGHRLYAAAIDRLLDAAWREPLAEPPAARPRPMPALPLDAKSYYHGRLEDIRRAELGPGWTLVPRWNPSGRAQADTRPRFVDVPMLVAESPGAELRLRFEGTAVGVWIVAGPDIGVIECSVDGGPARDFDQFTCWSPGLHLPWTLVLEDELEPGTHELALRTTGRRNPASLGAACRIVHFLVNGPQPR